MRVLIIDDDGRPLVNTAIDITSENPDLSYSFKEAACAVSEPDPALVPLHFLSKLQAVLSYLGTACLTRLVQRFNGRIQDPRHCRSIMDEQVIAYELAQAITHINNAYQRVQPFSSPGSNALAKISHDLGHTFHAIQDGGEKDPFAHLAGNNAPRHNPDVGEIAQPEGLDKTYFRQRPRETWVHTALRVLGDEGYHSLDELHNFREAEARKAAIEVIRIKKVSDALDIKLLQTIARAYEEKVSERTFNEPRPRALPPGLAHLEKPSAYRINSNNLFDKFDVSSPLRAEAQPFTPGSPRKCDGLPHQAGAATKGLFEGFPDVLQAHDINGPIKVRNILPIGAGRPIQTKALGSPLLSASEAWPPPTLRSLASAPLAPIGHERAQPAKLQTTLNPKKEEEEEEEVKNPPETWEDEITQEDYFGESHQAPSPIRNHSHDEPKGLRTPRAIESPNGETFSRFEVSGPESPSYITWAERAASGDNEAGWEKVEKGKKAAHPTPIRENIPAASITHKVARYVIISGCRTGTTLSAITSRIDTGPLVSVELEKKSQDGSVTARVLFVFGSHALDFLSNENYSRAAHGESLYGPGVTVALGPAYTGALCGITVPLNQAGRSDAGAHFERRRLTFTGSGLSLSEGKIRNACQKLGDVQECEIEVIIVFNPGNATAVFASVLAARKVRDKMTARKSGEWKHCKIMYSSDPCEKHLAFMDKYHKEQKQADRAEIVRRAYQKAGKINC